MGCALASQSPGSGRKVSHAQILGVISCLSNKSRRGWLLGDFRRSHGHIGRRWQHLATLRVSLPLVPHFPRSADWLYFYAPRAGYLRSPGWATDSWCMCIFPCIGSVLYLSTNNSSGGLSVPTSKCLPGGRIFWLRICTFQLLIKSPQLSLKKLLAIYIPYKHVGNGMFPLILKRDSISKLLI